MSFSSPLISSLSFSPLFLLLWATTKQHKHKVYKQAGESRPTDWLSDNPLISAELLSISTAFLYLRKQLRGHGGFFIQNFR